MAAFKDSYERVIETAHETWQALYRRLKSVPDTFNYLDAGQLVRHYLGVKTQRAPGGAHAGKRARLVYLYWEPANAAELQPCRTHSDEVRAFASQVDDPEVPFVAVSYRELWDSWKQQPDPPWLAQHVAELESRYAAPLLQAPP